MVRSTDIAPPALSTDERIRFSQDGFLVLPGLADASVCERMKSLTEHQASVPVEPVEFESDTRYEGAPPSRDAPGGGTVRRLLQAYARDETFRRWSTSATLGQRLRQLLGPSLVMSQAHHNCVMTKHPAFSSVTGWHQDIRYWSFERPDLVSAWLALGPEHPDNGGLLVVPGSHALGLSRERFDERLFFRTDIDVNRALLDTRVSVSLQAGDVLLFHARLLHAAGRNVTSLTKYAAVFTYHARDNRPIPGTRSASLPEVLLDEP